MESYGYTTKQWQEEVTKDDKVLMVQKRQLEIERDNRVRENSESSNNNKGRR